MQCRYLLHLQGYTFSSRLKYLLTCGSPVIFAREEEMHQEFWHHMLQDGANIVYMGAVLHMRGPNHLRRTARKH
ncbi:MAG: hypothetical protein H7210_09840 [Pyrinomonadaceae bacterium]|nr:hypothetical protein [Phycisphaerales bacterium]